MTRVRRLDAHLFVFDVDAAVSFYYSVLGAQELFRTHAPSGAVMFVELAVGDARLLVSPDAPAFGTRAPGSASGPSPVQLTVTVDDADAVVRRAAFNGAVIDQPVERMFWGEDFGRFRDPFGHRWAVTTGRELLTPSEMADNVPSDLTLNQAGGDSGD